MTPPTKPSPETGEADVKAAREVLWGLYAYPPHSTVQALAAALASARFEGSCEMLDRLRNSLKFWPEDGCDIGIATEVSRLLASARAEGEAAGVAKEREAVVRWLRETVDQMRGVLHQFEGERLVSAQRAYARKHAYGNAAASIERGDHLRALTPEGKR